MLAILGLPLGLAICNSWKKALSRSDTNIANVQINSYIHLQFICRSSSRGIWCKPNRCVTTSHSLRRRPWSWSSNRWPPFRNDWPISCYYGWHASRRLLHYRSRICPQFWCFMFFPFSYWLLVGACIGQCPWIACGDVYAKDKRACERCFYSYSFLGSWLGVSLFVSLYT